MAREIDFDNLTEEDYPYLQARSSLVKEAELQGHEGIREKVDSWKPEEAGEYDYKQDVKVAPQILDASAAAEEEEDDELEDDETEEVDYKSASKDELVAELKARELPTSGTKDELVARLEADDEAEEEEV